MTHLDELTIALLADAHAPALARAVDALAALRAWPPFLRHAYTPEARRLAFRAAVALLELVDAAQAHDAAGQEGER